MGYNHAPIRKTSTLWSKNVPNMSFDPNDGAKCVHSALNHSFRRVFSGEMIIDVYKRLSMYINGKLRE